MGKKSWKCFVGLVVLVSLISVVGLSTAPMVSAAETITIRYASWMIEEPYAKPIILDRWKKFEEMNPGVKIEGLPIPFTEAVQQYMVAKAAGNMPDVMMLLPQYVSAFSGLDCLADLHQYWSKEELAELPRKVYEAGVFDGKLLTMPIDLAPYALFAWKPLLKKAGLPEKLPKTYDELNAAIEKIATLGPNTYGLAARTAKGFNTTMWFLPTLWAFGGEFCDANGKVVFNNPGTLKALDWFKKLAAKKEIPLGVAVRETRMYWAQGNMGFLIDGPWMRGVTRELSGRGEKADADWIAGPIPNGPGNANGRTLHVPHVVAVAKSSKHADIAAKLIRYEISDPEVAKVFYLQYGGIPVMKRFEKASWYDDYARTFRAVSEIAEGNPSRDPNLVGGMEVASDVLAAAVNQQDVTKLLAEKDAEIKKLFKQR